MEWNGKIWYILIAVIYDKNVYKAIIKKKNTNLTLKFPEDDAWTLHKRSAVANFSIWKFS